MGLVPRVQALESAAGPVSAAVPAETSTDTKALRGTINDLESRLGKVEFQNTVVLDWADTMYKDHKSLQRQVAFNTSKQHANEVIVGGAAESKTQSNREAAMEFFRSKLAMTVSDSDIFSARRLGKFGKTITVKQVNEAGDSQYNKVHCPRHLLVKCSPAFKTELMSKKKALGGQIDPAGYKYFVNHYLPESFKAAQDKHRPEYKKIVIANKGKKKEADRIPVRMVGTDLIVNNKVVRGIIQPPSPGDVCKAKVQYSMEMKSFDLLATKPLPHGGSTFYGFAIRASTLLAVYLAYCKVRILVSSARHIMLGYDVAGVEDSCDDGENFGGLLIAKELQKRNLQGVALFVARETGPDQLGPKRFHIIRTLVDELFQILEHADKVPVDVRWLQRGTTAETEDHGAAARLAASASTSGAWASHDPTHGTVNTVDESMDT